ncbi:PTPA-CTERM sorting domain-containing protein [Caballeronia sp. INDeC2]
MRLWTFPRADRPWWSGIGTAAYRRRKAMRLARS